jgi:hypothetical protein
MGPQSVRGELSFPVHTGFGNSPCSFLDLYSAASGADSNMSRNGSDGDRKKKGEKNGGGRQHLARFDKITALSPAG